MTTQFSNNSNAMVMSPTVTKIKQQLPSLFSAPSMKNYTSTGLVQCSVYREEAPSALATKRFGLLVDGQLFLLAEKQGGIGKTPSFKIYDATRGSEWKLHIGDLKRDKGGSNNNSYTLVKIEPVVEGETRNSLCATFQYDVATMMDQCIEGKKARQLQVLLPFLDDDANEVTKPQPIDMQELAVAMCRHTVLRTLPPKQFAPGKFVADYGGRITQTSKKNMQLSNMNGEIVAQFGRVGKNQFHLDYKSPLNIFQAFGFALAQMDY